MLTARNYRDLPAVVAFCRDNGFSLEVHPVAVPATHPLAVHTLDMSQRHWLAEQIRAAGDLLGRPAYYAMVNRYLMTGKVRPLSDAVQWPRASSSRPTAQSSCAGSAALAPTTCATSRRRRRGRYWPRRTTPYGNGPPVQACRLTV